MKTKQRIFMSQKINFSNEKELRQFVEKFEKQTLPLSEWNHEAHLTVAFWYLKKYTFEEAVIKTRTQIISYNNFVGIKNTNESGYHETITLFWLKIIHIFINKNKNIGMVKCLKLFFQSAVSHKDFIFQYYTFKKLFSVKARALWIEPNKKI